MPHAQTATYLRFALKVTESTYFFPSVRNFWAYGSESEDLSLT